MRALPVLLSALFAYGATAQTPQSLTFAEDERATPNPGRGLYSFCDPMTGASPAPLDLSACGSAPASVTVLFRYFELGAFVDGPISQAYLDRMSADFALIRAAGYTLIPRFAYDADPPEEDPPFDDATKARVLEHIAQVAPILAANADVILALQAGFIGLWGEWYYTDHFAQSPDVITAANYADRREVLDALLAALPADRAVQIRVPAYKMEMYGTTAPLSDADAHGGSTRARVAHHNDCFLATPTDMGTYREDRLAADRAYLAAESRNLVMGGETCAPDPDEGPSRFDCPSALAEMATFHWTYLHDAYYEPALDRWRSDGCFDEIEARLGYRLVLESGSAPAEVRPGRAFPFTLALRNDGFAALAHPRAVGLVLRHQGTGDRVAVTLPEDPRRWYPGARTLTYELGVSDALPTGTYDLFLHMPDAAPGLHGDARYAVRTSNLDVWDASLGMNRLGTVEVSSTASGPDYTGDLWFGDHGVSVSPRPVSGLDLRVGPSPFQSSTTLRVGSARPGRLRVEILDVRGRVVQVPWDGAVAADTPLRIVVDGSGLAPGVYAVRAFGPDGAVAHRRVVRVD